MRVHSLQRKDKATATSTRSGRTHSRDGGRRGVCPQLGAGGRLWIFALWVEKARGQRRLLPVVFARPIPVSPPPSLRPRRLPGRACLSPVPSSLPSPSPKPLSTVATGGATARQEKGGQAGRSAQGGSGRGRQAERKAGRGEARFRACDTWATPSGVPRTVLGSELEDCLVRDPLSVWQRSILCLLGQGGRGLHRGRLCVCPLLCFSAFSPFLLSASGPFVPSPFTRRRSRPGWGRMSFFHTSVADVGPLSPSHLTFFARASVHPPAASHVLLRQSPRARARLEEQGRPLQAARRAQGRAPQPEDPEDRWWIRC